MVIWRVGDLPTQVDYGTRCCPLSRSRDGFQRSSSPPKLRRSYCAPSDFSSLMISSRLKCSAHPSGVAPYAGSVADRSAPRSTSSSTTLTLLLLAAQWSGVPRPSKPEGTAVEQIRSSLDAAAEDR